MNLAAYVHGLNLVQFSYRLGGCTSNHGGEANARFIHSCMLGTSFESIHPDFRNV